MSKKSLGEIVTLCEGVFPRTINVRDKLHPEPKHDFKRSSKAFFKMINKRLSESESYLDLWLGTEWDKLPLESIHRLLANLPDHSIHPDFAAKILNLSATAKRQIIDAIELKVYASGLQQALEGDRFWNALSLAVLVGEVSERLEMARYEQDIESGIKLRMGRLDGALSKSYTPKQKAALKQACCRLLREARLQNPKMSDTALMHALDGKHFQPSEHFTNPIRLGYGVIRDNTKHIRRKPKRERRKST